MVVLKLIKDVRELYVLNNPTSYSLAIEYGWTFSEVSIPDDTILNDLSNIN